MVFLSAPVYLGQLESYMKQYLNYFSVPFPHEQLPKQMATDLLGKDWRIVT